MNLRRLKDRFLAIPWVYNTLRPIVAGGIDIGRLVSFCRLDATDRVFDFGCGTAQPLEFVRCNRYLGVDLDPLALKKASRFSSDSVRFVAGDAWDSDCRELRPTVVLMIGVVHHLSDDVFHAIVRRVREAAGPGIPRLVTIDVTYFRGRFLNNLLSSLDRGRHVRKPEDYERLFRAAGLQIVSREVLPTRLRYVRYVGFHLAFN